MPSIKTLMMIPKSKIYGNYLGQKILERRVKNTQYLMGIAAGTKAAKSGEKAIFKVLENKIKGPLTIFDVGANVGQFMQLSVENLTRTDYLIHCFEPGRITFKTLLANTTNNDKRVIYNNFGLGSKLETRKLFYDNPGSGLASLTKRRLEHFDIQFEDHEVVSIKTVDSYCEENSIFRINLLKLDVEGHELDVLAGASRMFENNLIDMITFEFGGCNIDTKTYFQDFFYFFKEKRMSVFRITPSGYLFPIKTYKEIDEQFRTTNFLVVNDTV